MLLELRYSEKAFGQVAAALIPGNNPALWLAEIGRWGITPSALKCFVMPESIASNKAGGLFVIFSGSDKDMSVRYPYRRLADGFFIPVNSFVYPEVLPDEIKALKLWDVQVFHPATGLVGFEAKDEIKLKDLLDVPDELEDKWLTDFPVVKPYPQLMSISLEPDEQAMDAMGALSAD